MRSFPRANHLAPSARRLGRDRKNKRSIRLENLETRTLLSAITSYQTDASLFTGLTADVNDSEWTADGSALYHFTSSGMLIGDPLTFTDPNGTPYAPFDVVFSHYNDHLYFSDTTHSAICEVTLGGDLINVFQVPNTSTETPGQLAVTSDGAVWFTTQGGFPGPNFTYSAEIGRLDHFGNMTFAAITDGSQPNEIAAAADGTVWFDTLGAGAVNESGQQVQQGNAGVGHVALGDNGAINVDQFYAFSTPGSLGSGLTVAGDGSLWYAVDNRTGAFEIQPQDGPDRIVHGVVSSGNLLQTEYVLPGAASDSSSFVGAVALDNSDRLWFTQATPGQISYMNTVTGNFTQMAVPATAGNPVSLIIANGHVWAIGMGGSDNLMRVVLDGFTSPVVAGAPNISVTTGQAYTGTLLTFQTADNGPYTYSVDYGNGQTDSGTIIPDGSGTYTIPANVTYAADGHYATAVLISTADGNTITTRGMATASTQNTNPINAQGINLTGQQDIALASNMNINGDHVLAVATFSAPTGTYTATVTWGDGTSSTAIVRATSTAAGVTNYAVNFKQGPFHKYNANGVFNGSVTISGGGNTATVAFTATISDTPMVVSQNLSINPPQKDGTIIVAKFTDDIEATTGWFTATINWGDGTTSQGIVMVGSGGPGHFYVVGFHTYTLKGGKFTITTTITNLIDGNSSVATGYNSWAIK